jgi:hypothetical protein
VQQWTDGGGEGVLIADVDEVKKIPTDSVWTWEMLVFFSSSRGNQFLKYGCRLHTSLKQLAFQMITTDFVSLDKAKF